MEKENWRGEREGGGGNKNRALVRKRGESILRVVVFLIFVTCFFTCTMFTFSNGFFSVFSLK